MSNKVKVAVLVSGGGTNLQTLLDTSFANADIALVVSSNPCAYALTRASKVNVPTAVLNFAPSVKYEAERQLCELLHKYEIGLIVLAGFLPILSGEFTSRYPYRIINIHPSLIPKFCGKGYYGIKVHQAVMEAKEQFTGATVHFVNEVTDGGEIIIQKTVQIAADDTAEVLQLRVMQQAERIILPQAVRQLTDDIVSCVAPYGKQLPKSVSSILSCNTYHGRGIIAGLDASANNAVLAYFISGRSANSRNRVFVPTDNGFGITPNDYSKVDDPSLILYNPIARLNGNVVLTNGDQTDTIFDHLQQGQDMLTALNTRHYEPDCPNYTPRISCLMQLHNKCFTLSLLSRAEEGECDRTFYAYPLRQGVGRYICTYSGSVTPLPSFAGTPLALSIPESIDEFTSLIWHSLQQDNKISLYVEYLSLKDGKRQYRIINKYPTSNTALTGEK